MLNGPQLHRHHRGIFNPTLLFLLQTVDPLLESGYLGFESSLVVFHLFHDFIVRHGRLPSPSSPPPVPTRTAMTFAVTISPMTVTKASHHITSDCISLSISVPIYMLRLTPSCENQSRLSGISRHPQSNTYVFETRSHFTLYSKRPKAKCASRVLIEHGQSRHNDLR